MTDNGLLDSSWPNVTYPPSVEEVMEVQEWLIEPRTNFSHCPAGFICDRDVMANCTKIRMVSLMYGFGEVHAGAWCPEGEDDMFNCPLGHYCPTADLLYLCPEGYYCPHKTAHPQVECSTCDAGSLSLLRQDNGYSVTIFLVVVFVLLAWSFILLLKRYENRVYLRFVDRLFDRTQDMAKSLGRRKERRQQVQRLRPKLFAIHQRLKSIHEETDTSSHTSSERQQPSALGSIANSLRRGGSADSIPMRFQSSGKIQYQAGRLFDALDKDGNGQLDYDELQKVLELNPLQLEEFVRCMNELAGNESKSVNRRTFVRYFLRVLEQTSNFGPTHKEVQDLFDELAQGGSELEYSELFQSRLTFFLSDPQIHDMIIRFRRLQVMSEGTGGSSDLSRRSRMSIRLSLSGSLRGGTTYYRNRTISREMFVEHYPIVLQEVTTKPDAIPSKLGVDLAFQDLSLNVKVRDKSITVVNKVSGRLEAATMTALMGGSGVGKTSLLNALCGRAFYAEKMGTTFINGRAASIEDHRSSTGFVPQDDIVHAELTVKENLMYSGRFNLPVETSIDEIEDLADGVLANLGLSLVANSIVGDVNRRGVSGGEKKRVNIGVELMSRPSILFLDEPTSGLDSSSALMVMGSLKNLVEKEAVTVLSAIHQPRKAIFDCFDSLVLLGFGGNMVYHGPILQVENYFSNMTPPYRLPIGESLADWLLDVSSGRLPPDEVPAHPVIEEQNESQIDTADEAVDTDDDIEDAVGTNGVSPDEVPIEKEHKKKKKEKKTKKKKKDKKKKKKKKHVEAPLEDEFQMDTDDEDADIFDFHDDAVVTHGVSENKFEHSLEKAMERRQALFDTWNDYYDELTEEERTRYLPPTPYALPVAMKKPPFFTQFKGQIQRNVLMTYRNSSIKLVDSIMIVGAVVMISWVQGTTYVTRDIEPNLKFDQLVTGDPIAIFETFPKLFLYATSPTWVFIDFGMKVGVITSVLLGLTAAKNLTSKRLEFFREASSGWDVNAYFLALNITTLLEHTCQMMLAAICSYWLRNSLTTWYAYQVHFLMLMWLTVSWGLFIPLLAPANNVVLAVGFFMAFFGLLFSGGIEPVFYEDIYKDGNEAMALFTGIFSVTRFFIEGMTVQEQRCLPEQTGYSVVPESVNFPLELTSFAQVGIAGNDASVIQPSCDGWYWGAIPALVVGLFIRFLAAGTVHISDRGKQAKKSLWHDLKKEPAFRNRTTFAVIFFVVGGLGLFFLSAYLILESVGESGLLPPPEENETAVA